MRAAHGQSHRRRQASIVAAVTVVVGLVSGPFKLPGWATAANGSQPIHDPAGGPVIDVAAPLFWDHEAGLRAGGEADRFELDNPARMAGRSAWYHLSYVVGSDRLRVYDHNPPTKKGADSAIAHSANVAWHVANVLLGHNRGLAHAGELPAWARPRSGGTDGPSAGLLFTLADLDLLTPGPLAGPLRVAATGAIGSDGVVTPVRMVDAKLAAARLANVNVMFAPDFPDTIPVTMIASHLGNPTPERTIGDWVNTTGYEQAGRLAAHNPSHRALVTVDDIRQALAWLCGRTNQPITCTIAHITSSAPLALARPYQFHAAPPPVSQGQLQ
jgi:hypothetical protein